VLVVLGMGQLLVLQRKGSLVLEELLDCLPWVEQTFWMIS